MMDEEAKKTAKEWENLTGRNASQVFEDHLKEGKHGSVDQDALKNYAEDVVLFTRWGIYRGHEGLKQLAKMLRDELPHASFEYHTKLVADEIAFLEWSAKSKSRKVEDGADSFLIRDGKIVAQTIHYTVSEV